MMLQAPFFLFSFSKATHLKKSHHPVHFGLKGVQKEVKGVQNSLKTVQNRPKSVQKHFEPLEK